MNDFKQLGCYGSWLPTGQPSRLAQQINYQLLPGRVDDSKGRCQEYPGSSSAQHRCSSGIPKRELGYPLIGNDLSIEKKESFVTSAKPLNTPKTQHNEQTKLCPDLNEKKMPRLAHLNGLDFSLAHQKKPEDLS